MEKQFLIIEVSAHSNNGRYIGDELVNVAKWQFENIGGKFINSEYIRPSNLLKQPYYKCTFEFEQKVESPYVMPTLSYNSNW